MGRRSGNWDLPAFNRPVLCYKSVQVQVLCYKTCTGQGSRKDDPGRLQKPGNGETAEPGVPGWAEGLMAGPGLPAVTSGVCAAGTSVPLSSQHGVG